MRPDFVRVGNIIKRKRPSDGDAPTFQRSNDFSPEDPAQSLLHNNATEVRRDGETGPKNPLPDNCEFVTRERLKRLAVVMKKDQSIPHHQALNLAAQEYGYRNFEHFRCVENRHD